MQFFDLNLQSRQGKCFPAAVAATSTRDPNGQVTELRWMIRDISDRKLAEAALL